MQGKDIHFIDIDKNNSICFFPHTKCFFKINKAGKDLLADLDSEVIKADVLRKFNISEEAYLKYLKMFLENKAPEQKPASVNNFNPYHLKKLDRLVINISNDCNLNCVYCYANGGSYKSDKSIMNKNTMDSILSCFYSYCNSCFARKLCSNCLGFSLLDAGNPFKLSDESCIMTKKMAEKAMVGLAYL